MLAAVILTMNEYVYTVDAVKSLLAGRMRPDLIYVIDNGSTTSNFNLLSEALSEFQDVRLLRNETNVGFAKGSNMGIKAALAEGAQFVLLFNNDATVSKDCVVRLHEAIRRNPGIGMVGPRIYYYDDPHRIWQEGGYFNKVKAAVSVPKKNQVVEYSPQEQDAEVSFLTGCILLIRRETFDTVGLLDEDYFFYTEDLDYSLRVKKSGLKVVFVPSAQAWHRVSPYKQDDISSFRIYHRTRNHILCLRKNFSLSYFIYGSMVFLAVFMPYRIVQALKAKDRVRAIGAVLSGTARGLLLSSLKKNQSVIVMNSSSEEAFERDGIIVGALSHDSIDLPEERLVFFVDRKRQFANKNLRVVTLPSMRAVVHVLAARWLIIIEPTNSLHTLFVATFARLSGGRVSLVNFNQNMAREPAKILGRVLAKVAHDNINAHELGQKGVSYAFKDKRFEVGINSKLASYMAGIYEELRRV